MTQINNTLPQYGSQKSSFIDKNISKQSITSINNITSWGNLSTNKVKWISAILASNGHVIGVPTNSNEILDIDPINKSYELWGNLSASTNNYECGVLAPNGHVICIPYRRTTFLDIDPINKTYETWGNIATSTNVDWRSCVVASNGHIIGIPASRTQILDIDPINKSYELYGNFDTSLNKWYGGCLTENNHIICIPMAYQKQILDIDPINKTYEIWGDKSIASSNNNWGGGTLLSNGHIICMPKNNPQFLDIDPINKKCEVWGDLSNYTFLYRSILLNDGNVLAIPTYQTTRNSILIINPYAKTYKTYDLKNYDITSHYSWIDCTLTKNNHIIGVPYYDTKILDIELTSNIFPNIFDFPRSDLQHSKYNTIFNKSI